MNFSIKIGLVLFLFFGLSVLSYGQLSDYLRSIKIEELHQLQQGVLLVEMLDKSSIDLNNAIMQSVDSVYSYSKVYFYYPEHKTDSLPSLICDLNGNPVTVTLAPEDIFILKFYREEFDLPEEWRFLKKRDDEILLPQKKKDSNTAFTQELDLFSPYNTTQGGAFLYKYQPIVKSIEAKKRIIADYYVFARFHIELPPELRYFKAIERIQEIIVNREIELGI